MIGQCHRELLPFSVFCIKGARNSVWGETVFWDASISSFRSASFLITIIITCSQTSSPALLTCPAASRPSLSLGLVTKPCPQGRAWHPHIQAGGSHPILSSKKKGSPFCLGPQQALPISPSRMDSETLCIERAIERRGIQIHTQHRSAPQPWAPWDGGSGQLPWGRCLRKEKDKQRRWGH